jgi:hypothetical protein
MIKQHNLRYYNHILVSILFNTIYIYTECTTKKHQYICICISPSYTYISCIYICTQTNIHIYIERERQRDRVCAIAQESQVYPFAWLDPNIGMACMDFYR